MKFVSASTSLESILDSFSKENDGFLSNQEFKKLRNKIGLLISNEVENQVPPDDIVSMLNRIPDINRRSYRKNAEGLLNSLGIFDDDARKALKEIVPIRDRIIHSGRFVDPQDKRKAAKVYFELGNILTKVFLKILVPDDDTFYQQPVGPWKFVD